MSSVSRTSANVSTSVSKTSSYRNELLNGIFAANQTSNIIKMIIREGIKNLHSQFLQYPLLIAWVM